jgi:hypothetical protein
MEEVKASIPAIAHDLTALREVAIDKFLVECGVENYRERSRIVNESMELFVAERSNVDLYDDVLPALKSLKENG